jgi:hypothetical protein
MLERLFKDFNYQLKPGAKPEQKLKDIAMGTARLSGKLDLINESKSDIQVVDYKTGKGIGSLYTADKSKQMQVWKYKTQLTFYQILLERSGRIKNTQLYTGKMVFLETEDQKYLEQSYQPSQEEIARLSNLLQAVWNKIINLDLPDVSQYSADYAGMQEFEKDLLKEAHGN